jgi:hypothetical protein
MGERHTQRGNVRLRSSSDSAIFHQKEPELMTKMTVRLARSSYDKCVARHPTCFLLPKPGPHKDSSGYDASRIFKRRQRRRGALHYFTRILLAMKGKEKRGIVIQQQSVIYLSWLRHGR